MSIAQYFAQIDDDNFVTDVHVVSQEFINENPERYQGIWVETFLDVEGKTYAGIGYTYDAELDDFVAPDPVIPES
jgi:hypothetical protein